MTLAVCICDTRDHEQAARTLAHTVQVMQHCHEIQHAYWVSDQPINRTLSIPVSQIQIPTLRNFPFEYNYFCLRHMPQFVKESHVMVIQTDGYPVNAQAWTPEFLRYDYIGAVMSPQWVPHRYAVGNGGFSLRSKKLLNALEHIQPDPHLHHEDTTISWHYRHVLEDDHHIQFAPHDLADRFSIEYHYDTVWLGKSLGFHGKHLTHLYPLSDHI